MRKLLTVAIVLAGVYVAFGRPPSQQASPATVDVVAAQALDRDADQSQVTGSGSVSKILSDDNDGSRHQRFIVRLPSGQTVLIAHNLDLAPRVAPLAPGDTVQFKGEYVWSDKGGTVHWTHRDPAGRHEGGWLKHAGQTFQ
jgi:Protein of unknown function (DUF3465)